MEGDRDVAIVVEGKRQGLEGKGEEWRQQGTQGRCRAQEPRVPAG